MKVRYEGTGRTAARRVRAAVLPVIVAGTLIALATACGGAGSSSSQEPSADAQAAAGLKYGNCMRAHGVTNFPQPGGGPQTGPPINLSSPTYLAAEKACAQYAGGGPVSTQEASPQVMRELLQFVDCMRTHGVPDMPDPNSNGTLSLPSGRTGGISASSPQFQSAQQACQKYYPSQGGGS
jgi:hypothetical protein